MRSPTISKASAKDGQRMICDRSWSLALAEEAKAKRVLLWGGQWWGDRTEGG